MRIARWLILLGLILLLWKLQQQFWHGLGGSEQVRILESRTVEQRLENERLGQRNAALAAEVKDLKEGGDAIEERARSELGMIKPGEVFYRVVDTAPVADHGDGNLHGNATPLHPERAR
ncbi:MAG: cell division protein FtsB [Xanthomonadaceae bacterium]|jgi:cell division protein FtsB|nr:cell division protein FtsB [Xanthomonadaceae bacterium]